METLTWRIDLYPRSQARRRIVVKVGMSTLTAGTDALNPPRMLDLVRQLAALRASGLDVVLVSSGAQVGRERPGFPQESKTIPQTDAGCRGAGAHHAPLGAVLELYDVIVAQVLLTRQDRRIGTATSPCATP